jgi:hypothetical protein
MRIQGLVVQGIAVGKASSSINIPNHHRTRLRGTCWDLRITGKDFGIDVIVMHWLSINCSRRWRPDMSRVLISHSNVAKPWSCAFRLQLDIDGASEAPQLSVTDLLLCQLISVMTNNVNSPVAKTTFRCSDTAKSVCLNRK